MPTEIIRELSAVEINRGKSPALRFPGNGAQAPYYLQTIGTTKLFASSGRIIPVRSKRGLAMILMLSLTEGHAVSRRRMAALLWSKSSDRALDYLRGILHGLKQDLISAAAFEPLVVAADKYLMLPANVLVADVVALSSSDALQPIRSSTIGADLEGIDSALDAWLEQGRVLFAALHAAQAAAGPGNRVPPPQTEMSRRGAVVGIAPLERFGLHADHQHLPYALAEEIEESLALMRCLIVISSASVAAALVAGKDLKQELGLDVLVRGRVEGNPVSKAAFQLIDMDRQSILWTAKFHDSADDIFAFKNRIAASLAAAFEPMIPHILGEQLRGQQTIDGSVYNLLLLAIAGINSLEKTTFLESGSLLDRAIAMDASFAAAFSWKALWGIFLVGQGWATNVEEAIAEAGLAADQAISLDPRDARGLTVAGHVQAFLHGRHDEAMMLHEQALAINPSLSLAWHLSGVCCVYKGELTLARLHLERCSQLEPVGPHSFFREGAQLLLELLSKDYSAAILLGRRLTKLYPRFTMPYKVYISAAGHLGLLDEALIIYNRLLAVEPSFGLEKFRASLLYKRQEHIDLYVEGLKLAGVR